MSIKQNPVYRKVIVPWYDTDTACYILLVLVGAIFLFSLTGVSVARENVEYIHCLWIPAALLALSGGVFVSLIIRMVRRRYLGRNTSQ